MDFDKNATLSLHMTVKEAISGDAGWCWYEGKWVPGQINPGSGDDDGLYVDLILEDNSQWFTVEDLADLPWFPIVRPPYEGNEVPCTHAVVIMDRATLCTMSWNADITGGKNMSGKIMAYIEAMLRETDAPTSFGSS